MTRAEEAVRKVSGMDCKDCYGILVQAVDAAYASLPDWPRMHNIVQQVCARTGMSPAAVSKALSRATADIWDHGDRTALEEVFGHPLGDGKKPLPRELVVKLAQFMSRPVEYRLWEDKRTGRCGIAVADPVTGRWLAVAPFRSDKDLGKFVQFLNRIQAPLEDFQELFLDSGLLDSL